MRMDTFIDLNQFVISFEITNFYIFTFLNKIIYLQVFEDTRNILQRIDKICDTFGPPH